ncbi:MAG: PepSY domain-containing protein [Burkholderiaceae bacterium]|nr:PepSY domain-containing protein [Burkholderiaceae bacterium]
MKNLRFPARFFSFALAALTLAGAPAWPQAEHEIVQREVQSNKLKALPEILSGVQQRYPASRILDIELERGSDGRRWYEIKLLNGQRTTLYVDAVTGREIARPDAPGARLLPMAAVARQVLAAQPPGSAVAAVLEIELEDNPVASSPYYEIKLLQKDGAVRLLRADAQTGQPLADPLIPPEMAARLMRVDTLIAMVEKRYKARAIEAELKLTRQRQPYYEVDLLLPGGRAIEAHVDALTGQIIGEDALR